MKQRSEQGRDRAHVRGNNKNLWEVLKCSAFILALLWLVMACNGCNSAVNPLNKGVQNLIYINADNCTDAEVYGPGDEYILTVGQHSSEQETIKKKVLDSKDKTVRFFQTPQKQLDAIYAGERGVIPRGCDDWGFDVVDIYIGDGEDTDDIEIRLRPPDYWDDKSRWKADHPDLSAETVERAKVQFQNSLK